MKDTLCASSGQLFKNGAGAVKYAAFVSKIELKLCAVVGATCSMGALNFGVGSFYNYVMLLWILYKLMADRRNFIINLKGRYFSFFAAFLSSILLSFVSSYLVIDGVWRMSLVKLAFKYVMVFGFISCAYNPDEIQLIRKSFVHGLEIGSLIQLVWGYLQILLDAFFHIKLNTVVFSELLHITVGGNSVRFDHFVGGPQEAVIRMTGLGWEPANYSLIIIVGLILWMKKKKYVLSFFYLAALLLSTSRSGYVAFAVVLLYGAVFGIGRKRRIETNLFRFLLAFLAVLFLGTVFAGDSLSNRISGIIDGLKNITDFSVEGSSTSVHASYYKNLLKVLMEENPLNIMFGCGYFSAGYRFAEFYGQSVSSGIGWNPETDAVTLIVGNGILGACIYYYYAFKAVLRNQNNEWSYIVIAVIFEGITYLTVRGSWSMLLVLFALV